MSDDIITLNGIQRNDLPHSKTSFGIYSISGLKWPQNATVILNNSSALSAEKLYQNILII